MPRKQRYVAMTWRMSVYDVLNTRTSDMNGATPTIEAAAGSVMSWTCARSAPANASKPEKSARAFCTSTSPI